MRDDALETTAGPNESMVPAAESSSILTSSLPVDLVAEHLGELRAIARRLFRGEAIGNSQQATGLVHEMWIRLHESAGRGHSPPTNREEFLAFAARAMRSILVEWARRRQAIKRGGHHARIPLSEQQHAASGDQDGSWARSLLELEEELELLRERDFSCAEAFILRFYGGLTDAQIGDQLDLPPAKAGNLVRAAKAALRSRIFNDASKISNRRRSDPSS